MDSPKSTTGSKHDASPRADRLAARNGKKARTLRRNRWNYMRQLHFKRMAKSHYLNCNGLVYDSDATIPFEVPKLNRSAIDGYDSEATESIGDDTYAIYPMVTLSSLHLGNVDSSFSAGSIGEAVGEAVGEAIDV